MRLVDEIVDLRLRAFRRHPFYRRPPSARTAMRKAFAETLAGAKKTGALETLRGPDGKLLAAFAFGPTRSNQTGKMTLQATLDFRLPISRSALEWAERALTRHRKAWAHTEILLMMMKPYERALDAAYGVGLHIDDIVLIGQTRVARRALERKYGSLSWDDYPELEVHPIRTERQIRQVISIIREEFTRNPEYGWFVSSAHFLKRERDSLRKEAASRHPTAFVIESDGKVLGYFAAYLWETQPIWGSLGGMTFCLHRKLQGKGLAKYGYATLLREMSRRNIRCFVGGTSQLPVMRLGKVLKREPWAYMLKNGKEYFPREHFTY